MRGFLFAHNGELSDSAYEQYAKEAGLDVSRFRLDYTTAPATGREIDEDIDAGHSVGITGTPSFLLGTSDGKTIEGERIVGSKPFRYFQNKIDALLAASAQAAVTDKGEKAR